MTTDAPALPGLELPAPSAGPLERAVREHFGDPAKLGPLERVRFELCLEAAQVMRSKATSGRTSMYAQDAKLLAELMGFLGDAAGEAAGPPGLAEALEEWGELERRRYPAPAPAAVA